VQELGDLFGDLRSCLQPPLPYLILSNFLSSSLLYFSLETPQNLS
jgi:hypothetical protein